MIPPVRKAGAAMCCIRPSIVIDVSDGAINDFPKILRDHPGSHPSSNTQVPLVSMLSSLAGRTIGSSKESSELGWKTIVSLLASVSAFSAVQPKRAAV